MPAEVDEMNCPRCRTTLSKTTLDSIEVESCPSCRGMLLDHGELDRLAKPHDGDLEYSTLDAETFDHEDVHGIIDCPRCDGESMKKVEFNIYTEIILDYCGQCRAFWLDGSEMGRINEEVRKLDEQSGEGSSPAMLWFANLIWSLPR